MQPEARVRSVLAEAGYSPADFGETPMLELDSLLVEELLAIADDAAGHRVELETFGGLEGTVGSVVAFIDSQAAHG